MTLETQKARAIRIVTGQSVTLFGDKVRLGDGSKYTLVGDQVLLGDGSTPTDDDFDIADALVQIERDDLAKTVNSERDKRIKAGFEFGGKTYQGDDASLRNMTGAALSATLAIAGGALAGNYKWANPSTDFVWITADNEEVKMDAQTVVELGQTAMAYVSSMTMAARQIKNSILAGTFENKVADDEIWLGTI